MSKCSCENCNLEVFENSDKCILHCDKTKYHKTEDTILGPMVKCEDSIYHQFYDILIKNNKAFYSKYSISTGEEKRMILKDFTEENWDKCAKLAHDTFKKEST